MTAAHTSEFKRMAEPLPLSVAEYWESTARSELIMAKRARNYESILIHRRDAAECLAHAARIRAHIAAFAGSAA